MRSLENQRDVVARRTGLLAAGLAVVGGLLVLTAMDASRGHNALEVPVPGHQRWLRRLAPQKWSFFTRQPQAEDVAVWHARGGTWAIATPGASSEPRHLFGFDRIARAVDAEQGMLVLGVPDAAFQTCDAGLDDCLDALEVTAELVNPAPAAHLCGELAFVRRAPATWARARSKPDADVPVTAARVRVTC